MGLRAKNLAGTLSDLHTRLFLGDCRAIKAHRPWVRGVRLRCSRRCGPFRRRGAQQLGGSGTDRSHLGRRSPGRDNAQVRQLRRVHEPHAARGRLARAIPVLGQHAHGADRGGSASFYGLYAPYDVTDERGAVEKALDAPPALPELDEAMRALVAANDRLAPTLTKANGYYERGDYKLDRMVEGKALHKLIAADGDAFLAARARLERVMRVQKLALDQIRLATIEQRDGRKARWHVANVMMRGQASPRHVRCRT